MSTLSRSHHTPAYVAREGLPVRLHIAAVIAVNGTRHAGRGLLQDQDALHIVALQDFALEERQGVREAISPPPNLH